jgi:UDP-D-galactose:(glucosyl)LPS alpha-1,6-D-galactosyltransferase
MIIDVVLGYAVGKGGLENVIKLINDELEKRGHLVRLFQMAPPENLEWADSISNIYYYGEKESVYSHFNDQKIERFSSRYEQFTRLLGRPNVILATHTPVISYLCKMAVDKMKLDAQKPIILSWLHGPPEVFGGEKYLNFCDAHLAISMSIADKIKKSINRGTVYYIGNTINFNMACVIKNSVKQDNFIYIGRIENKQKRLDVLMHALTQLNGKWTLDIIGDGPSIAEIKQSAEMLNLYNQIKWHGWEEDPWNSVKDASVLILSSDFEGFALILIEALARGVPVISSNWNGAGEIVNEDKNGWLFPCGDSEKLHNILQDIIDGKKVLPNAETCMRSVDKYRVENVVDRMEQAIHQTLERRS